MLLMFFKWCEAVMIVKSEKITCNVRRKRIREDNTSVAGLESVTL